MHFLRNEDIAPLYTQTLEGPYKNQNVLYPHIFWLSLSIRLPKGKGEEFKAQGRTFFMVILACGVEIR